MIYRFVLLASLVAAQEALAPIPRSDGILLPGEASSPAATEVYLEAGRRPNASQEVNFYRYDNNSVREWTWRLAVSDLKVPSPIDTLGAAGADYSGDLHITNSQWQLSWNPIAESNQTLIDFLRERQLTMNVLTQQSIATSEQLAAYSGSRDGNCTALLGSKCVTTLIRTIDWGILPNAAGFDGCEDLFRYGPGQGSVLNLFAINPSTNRTAYTSNYPPERAEITPSGPLYYTSSESYQAGNLTAYNRTLGSLNLLVIGFNYNENVSGADMGDLGSASVLCQIVDKSRASGASTVAPGWTLIFATVFMISMVVF